MGQLWSWSYGSWIYNYLCDQCPSPLMLWVRIPLRRCVLDTTLYDKECQLLVAGQWFSPGTLNSSTYKTDHDITEILLKVALNTITLLTLVNQFSSIMIWHYLSKRHDNWRFLGRYFDFGFLNIKRFIILTLLTGRFDPAAARSIHMTTQHDPVRFNAVRLWLPTLMSTSCDNSSAFLKIR